MYLVDYHESLGEISAVCPHSPKDQLRHLSKGSVVVKLCCVGADDYEEKVAMRGGDEYKMVAEGSGRTQRRG